MRNWASRWLDMPADVTNEAPRVEMIGLCTIRVENHRGIVRFTGNQVTLKIKGGSLEIDGKDLKIRKIDADQVILEGTFRGLRYAGPEGE
ncbi:sporulation protein YqfC [Staphylospora marina]|uniref:sporulation protein YqfC n=1 Tax=Staphylospora marina TaxID=2490858 RepID=UPI000F5BFA2D|nr:sporulation protein YqfC [Staphylospora marina]